MLFRTLLVAPLCAALAAAPARARVTDQNFRGGRMRDLGALIGTGGGYLYDQGKQSQQRADQQGYQHGRASHR